MTIEILCFIGGVMFGHLSWWIIMGFINKGKTKPLSDEEIEKLREYHGINDWLYETSIIDFARAIEERHGIK